MACDAITLASDGKFASLENGQQANVFYALLCQILQTLDPMADCDALALAGSNPCFDCLEPGQKASAMFSLACSIFESISGLGSVMHISGNGDPNGVETAAVNVQYHQLDAPGIIWVHLGLSGTNTGWAINP